MSERPITAKTNFARFFAFGVLMCVSGCGVDVASLAETVQDMQSKHAAAGPASEVTAIPDLFSEDKTFLTAAEDTGIASDENLNQSGGFVPPYPDRTNPFEFGIEVAANVTPASEGKLEVQLYGFVGDEDPRAIIHLGNQTRIMGVGDQWGKLEVIEISPPAVRIRNDGLVRSWSLLGRDSPKVD